MLDFFLSFFLRFGTPTWNHVGHIFAQNGGTLWRGPPFLCWVYVLFRFFGRPGPLLAPFGLDFWGVGARFWEVLGFVLEISGDNLGIRLLLENLLFRSILLASGSGWAGGVTRSAKNLLNMKIYELSI